MSGVVSISKERKDGGNAKRNVRRNDTLGVVDPVQLLPAHGCHPRRRTLFVSNPLQYLL